MKTNTFKFLQKSIRQGELSKHKRLLLFYSGGLDTSFLLKFLSSESRQQIFTAHFDMGNIRSKSLPLRQGRRLAHLAKRLGSTKHFTLACSEAFVDRYCFPAVMANAEYNHSHPLSSSLTRPLMTKEGSALAKRLRCTAVVIGSTAWQNNPVRYAGAFRAVAPEIVVIEPFISSSISRHQKLKYLSKFLINQARWHRLSLQSADDNIWTHEIEDGNIDDLRKCASEEHFIYQQLKDVGTARLGRVRIRFSKGKAISLNDKPYTPLELVSKLNRYAGPFGIGRTDSIEDRVAGHKAREIHEAPAATILIQAHRELESLLLPRQLLSFKSIVDQRWTDIVCFGGWHHPLKETLDAFIAKASEWISGTVEYELKSGKALIGRRIVDTGLDIRKLNEVIARIKQPTSPSQEFFDFTVFESTLFNFVHSP